MNASKLLAAVMVAGTLALGGCAVTRDQSTVGQFVDDSAITTQVKARFAESGNTEWNRPAFWFC
jgi:hyperosmotically inducible protein